MRLRDTLSQPFPAPWRCGRSPDKAWIHVGAVKVEVSKQPGSALYAVTLKAGRGRVVGTWSGGDYLTLPDRLAKKTAEAVMRALEIGEPLTRADVPVWARHHTLKVCRRPCLQPRPPEWQARVDALAADLETP